MPRLHPTVSRYKALALLALTTLIVTSLVATTPPASAQIRVQRSAIVAAPAPHTVTWDKYSLMIDGERTFVWSGEFHPFRLPSPSLWLDILEKMKSNGYNAVSIYVDWAYHSPSPGVYDWTGVRDLDQFLDVAQQVGLYVIARPGPYINAEVDGGGYPGWLTTKLGHARTNSPEYLQYSDEYQSQVDTILARHQLTTGNGSVILYQIENENAANVSSAAGQDYMAHLYAKARADGITVPIFHNDKGRNGYWTPGSFPTPSTEQPANYLYGFDGYPAGTCSSSGNPGTPGAPPNWGYFGIGGAKGGASASPNTPGLLAEFGGGWFDPWGGKLMGGAGYPCLRTRQNAAMERQYYLTNVANGIKIQNVYMTYGGTSWGWLPAPLVYTSYDYGAAIDEARNLTSKLAPMKEIGLFLQSVTPITKVDPADAVAASDPAVKTYHVANPDTGTNFYFVRSDSTTAKSRFTLPVSTADGSWVVPQSGSIGLDGVDMKVLTADYDLDSSHLVYSTSEIMTHAANLGGQDLALLYTRDGQDGETVLRYPDASVQPAVETLSGPAPSVVWDAATKDLRLNYTGTGLSEIRIAGDGTRRPLLLLLAAESVAKTFSRLDTPAGPVIVRGPQLLRTATATGSVLALTGDTTASAPLEVWGPSSTSSVSWNGSPVVAQGQPSGSLLAKAALSAAPTVTLPTLTGWKAMAESPESAPDFDDSGWIAADQTTSNSRTPVPAGQPVLFADDYGYHYGDVWYRGRYSQAADATSVQLTYQTGQVGLLEAWLDGQYLGSDQLPTPTPAQSTTQGWTATASLPLPAGLRTAGDHILAVLIRPQGHEEDGGANDAFRNARGLLSATLSDAVGAAVAAPIAWKIQGVQGGETPSDPVRGPLNNGGLYGERAGWYLPGYPTTTWRSVTLPTTDARAGVTWYQTQFRLAIPAGVDTSVGITIADDPAKTYRAELFVNGWNLGQYINDVGPQHTFVVPNGVLDPRGPNTVSIAVISRDPGTAATGGASAAAGGLGAVTLTNLGTVRGGVPVAQNQSPGYVSPRLAPVSEVLAKAAGAWTGRLASIQVPVSAQGTSFTVTVDWGDGTTSSAGLTGTGASRDVSGTHVYARKGVFPVTLIVSDTHGPALARSRSLAVVKAAD